MKYQTLLRYIFGPLIVTAFATTAILAQPGDELERARIQAANLKTEIAAVSKQLVKNRASAELWEKRGDLYVRLYTIAFADGRVRADKLAGDLTETALVTKIIDDYTHAVWRDSKASEMFLKRGTAYALRWYMTSRVDWDKETRGNRDPKWNDIVDWEDRARQRAVFNKFITNPDFQLAMDDLDRSSRGRNDVAVEVAAEWAMGRICLESTRSIPYLRSEYARVLAEKGPTEYKIWDEYEEAIRHLADAEGQQMKYGPLQVLVLPLRFSNATYRDALFEMFQLRVAYGRDKDAIDSGYTSWIKADDAIACKYYTEVYNARVRLGQYDYIIDWWGVIEGGTPTLVCDAAHEPRGDAYMAKGEYAKALADYNIAAKYPSALESTLRLYVNRAKAYLKLGEKQKALDDLNTYLWHISGGNATPEDYILRASTLRELGKPDLAAADENTARDLKLTNETNAENRKRPGLIYGTVVMPNGKPVTGSETSGIVVEYADGTKEKWSPSLDEQGRFNFHYLKPQPFTLYAYSAGTRAGLPGRYVVRTQRFPQVRTHIGPITVTLSSFEKK